MTRHFCRRRVSRAGLLTYGSSPFDTAQGILLHSFMLNPFIRLLVQIIMLTVLAYHDVD